MSWILAFALWATPAHAETVFAKAEAASKRFADAETPGPTFEANAPLEVLVRDGERLRVRSGVEIGWVNADQVSAEMDLEALMRQLQEQMPQ